MLPAGELLRLGAWEFSVVQGVLFAENSLEASPIVPPVAPRPPPSLPYKVDTSRPSLRTNWTRLDMKTCPRSRPGACLAARRARLRTPRARAPRVRGTAHTQTQGHVTSAGAAQVQLVLDPDGFVLTASDGAAVVLAGPGGVAPA